MKRHCSHHCRPCGGHFTSLAAFDIHRKAGACDFEDERLVETHRGTCTISDPEFPILGITLYEHEDAARHRQYRRGQKAA